ncbi:acyltransferase family protein [Rhizobium herbae]|uniref:Peptidoglycan/LPS O-acetylase OafA/YrhL n=1 Tax=Rhizobium herbae TaxID=508661 RepID=A0ABS4EHA3_9HYPH|nr:acyltransferase family protein [Rhizobium herbae]MBP1857325.1 peptidoglycan/LPS O-acetylase OafA/YrhL [Rhizobium herbae]
MNYRREIDGLRSVAVIPVVLFHAGFQLFSGGFIGVDIFFVISGYLITSIIIAERDRGVFSLLKFYERRARRILPVLFFVLLCCLPFAWVWMLPAQMASFARSIIAVCLFGSNFLFWHESGGYFAAASEEQPLLHTWSLAVEEQYYMLFPLFVMLMWRFGRHALIGAIAAVALASLLLAQYGSVNFTTANFYLPNTRAWELLAGSLCAFLLAGGRQYSSNILSLTGLAIIVFSIFAYDEATPFPSLYALVPVLGAVLVILFASAGTLTAQLLSTRPMVGVGLISYSLYLWHQPVFALARIRGLTEPSMALMSLLALACVGLAYLSWRFIETPFRKGSGVQLLPTPARMLGGGAITAALFIGIGLYGVSDNGLQFRLPPDALTALAEQEHHDPVMDTCLFDKGEASLPHPVRDCLTQHSTASRTILIGDSHAAALAGEALRSFDSNNVDLYVMTHSACVGFSGFYVSNPKYKLRCDPFFRGIEDYIQKSGMATVIMASRWSLYVDGAPFDNGEGGIESLKPTYVDLLDRLDEHATQGDPARKARVLKQYVADIQKYLDAGRNVVLVYPIPEAGWNVPERVAKSAMYGVKNLEFSTSYDRYRQRNGAVIAAFDAISHPNLFRVRPADFFCDSFLKDRCINSLSAERVFYFDDDHLSDSGADLVVPAILAAVEVINGRTAGPALVTR